MSPAPPRIPLHVLEAHVFPRLGVDLRLALGVPPGKMDLSPFGAVRDLLARRPRGRTAVDGMFFFADFRVPSRGREKTLSYSVCGYTGDVELKLITKGRRWKYETLHVLG